MIIIYDHHIWLYNHHIWWSYPCKTLNSSSHEPCHVRRGYSNHTLSETDSDGDGGPAAQLTGRGHIEFSTKGIPHAIVNFVEQLRLAGHIFMHDTCAPEACHKLICKMAMNRARKGTEGSTNVSIMKWLFRRLTWSHIIRQVQKTHRVSVPIQKTRVSEPYKVIVSESKMLHPSDAVAPALLPYHFSPLRSGQHDFMCNDTRVTYHELGTLIARCMQWTPRHVFDHLRVRLYCSARVQHSSGESRSYWATESQYPWSRGRRRDFVEIDLGGGKIGIGQLTGFIEMDNLPANEPKVKVTRWSFVGWRSLPECREETTTTVLCVITRCRQTTVCGSGAKHPQTDMPTDYVVSVVVLLHKDCGIMFVHRIEPRHYVQRFGPVMMSSNMTILFDTSMLP